MKILFAALLFSLSACASEAVKVPALENRTLFIAKDQPGFYYQWRECSKKGLFGNCREEKMVIEYYDLRDEKVRSQLRDMGFKATSERKLKP